MKPTAGGQRPPDRPGGGVVVTSGPQGQRLADTFCECSRPALAPRGRLGQGPRFVACPSKRAGRRPGLGPRAGLRTRRRVSRLARGLRAREGVAGGTFACPFGSRDPRPHPARTPARSAENFLKRPRGWQLLERRRCPGRRGLPCGPRLRAPPQLAVPPCCHTGWHTARRASPARGYYPRGLQPLFRDLGRYNTCELK